MPSWHGGSPFHSIEPFQYVSESIFHIFHLPLSLFLFQLPSEFSETIQEINQPLALDQLGRGLVFAGGFVFLVSVFGYCGAVKESRFLLALVSPELVANIFLRKSLESCDLSATSGRVLPGWGEISEQTFLQVHQQFCQVESFQFSAHFARVSSSRSSSRPVFALGSRGDR